jgi:hypothetical protein
VNGRHHHPYLGATGRVRPAGDCDQAPGVLDRGGAGVGRGGIPAPNARVSISDRVLRSDGRLGNSRRAS